MVDQQFGIAGKVFGEHSNAPVAPGAANLLAWVTPILASASTALRFEKIGAKVDRGTIQKDAAACTAAAAAVLRVDRFPSLLHVCPGERVPLASARLQWLADGEFEARVKNNNAAAKTTPVVLVASRRVRVPTAAAAAKIDNPLAVAIHCTPDGPRPSTAALGATAADWSFRTS